jgi:hypothetical protein
MNLPPNVMHIFGDDDDDMVCKILEIIYFRCLFLILHIIESQVSHDKYVHVVMKTSNESVAEQWPER